MSAITWLGVEDGILYMYFGPCCKIAVAGDFATVIAPPPPGVEIDPDDPKTWACNKASGITDALVDIWKQLNTALSAEGSVYDMYQPAHDILKLHGSTWQTSQLVAGAFVADPSGIGTMITDPDTPQALKCVWAPSLANTDTLNASEIYNLSTISPPTFSSASRLWQLRTLNAVIDTTLSWWARLFHDSLADCSCPDEGGGGTEPGEDGWYLSDYQTELYGELSGDQDLNLWFYAAAPHDAYGLMFETELTGTWERIKRAGDCGWPDLPEDECLNSSTSESLNNDTVYGQMGGDASAELIDEGVPHTLISAGGRWSDSVESPIADVGDNCQWRIIIEGDPGDNWTARIRWRWLHNVNSASHS